MATEKRLGSTKGTMVEEQVEANFRGETSEVGLYLAMARQAEEIGYPEIATALKDIAWEEAAHAARFAEMNGKISSDLKENLERMLKGELGAMEHKLKSSEKSKDVGVDCAHHFFHESSKDEGRHAKILEGLLNRYFAD